MYNLPDLFLQLGAEAFEYPMYEKRPNLRFTGPLMPRLRDSMKATVWLEELDGARPLIFVTQGTLANFDFNQLVNPALDGLAEKMYR